MEDLNCCCSVEKETFFSELLEKLSDQEELHALSEFFKVYADPTRLKILQALLVSELCVCDLSAVIDVSQSAVSHQLCLLRKSSLVKKRREGRTLFYSLDDEHIGKILSVGLEHLREARK